MASALAGIAFFAVLDGADFVLRGCGHFAAKALLVIITVIIANTKTKSDFLI